MPISHSQSWSCWASWDNNQAIRHGASIANVKSFHRKTCHSKKYEKMLRLWLWDRLPEGASGFGEST